MNFLKICLVLITFVFFVANCSNSKPSNSSIASNASNVTASAPANIAPQPSATVDELASARKIYFESCVKCHKEDGTGGKVEIDGLTIKATNLTTDHMKKDSDQELIEQIENGGDGMPAYKDKLTAAEIKDLVKFIRVELQK